MSTTLGRPTGKIASLSAGLRSNAGVPNGFRTLWDTEYSQGYEGGLGFQPFDSAFVIHSISFGARENRPFFNKLAITMVSPI